MPISNIENNIHGTAGDLTVLRPDGTAVRLGSVWADRPAVLALVR